MNSPVHPSSTLQPRKLEAGLEVYECPASGGLWIPLQSYFTWKDRQPPVASGPAEPPFLMFQDDSARRTLICPESGRLLLRYRVGQGLPFHVDRSPATGGVWLDKGEWEGLKSRGLHTALHLIFTASYQREIRSSEYSRHLMETFQERIGTADFTKVSDFGSWLALHPKRRDILCFLMAIVDPEKGKEQ